MDGKQTPGPWRAGRTDAVSYHAGDGAGPFKNVYVDDPGGRVHMGNRLPAVVAEVYGPLGADCRANALLIAAAPDLLAACEASLPVVGVPLSPDECRALVLKLGAAIAKAKGEGI